MNCVPMDDEHEWEEPTWTASTHECVEEILPCSLFLMRAVSDDVKHNRMDTMMARLRTLTPNQLTLFLQEYHAWSATQVDHTDTSEDYVEEEDLDDP